MATDSGTQMISPIAQIYPAAIVAASTVQTISTALDALEEIDRYIGSAAEPWPANVASPTSGTHTQARRSLPWSTCLRTRWIAAAGANQHIGLTNHHHIGS